jgi:hypothetical protein
MTQKQAPAPHAVGYGPRSVNSPRPFSLVVRHNLKRRQRSKGQCGGDVQHSGLVGS